MKTIEMVDKKFGRWTVIAPAPASKNRHARWLCRCECGAEHEIDGVSLRNGDSQSCGCLLVDHLKANSHFKNRTYGMTQSPEFWIWQGMKTRCLNPNNPGFVNYGGRGISIDPSWLVFENFYRDMGERPSPKHTLDRIDNDKGYSKDNCQWATQKQQNNNRRSTLHIEFRGHTMTLKEWSEVLDMDYERILKRLIRGWTVERALSTPIRKYGHPRNTTSTDRPVGNLLKILDD